MGKLTLRVRPQYWQCPYCLRPVGWLGNKLAIVFGTQMHGCDFRRARATPAKEPAHDA